MEKAFRSQKNLVETKEQLQQDGLGLKDLDHIIQNSLLDLHNLSPIPELTVQIKKPWQTFC